MVPLAPKLKVITYHFISYRRKSVLNLVEIQNIIYIDLRKYETYALIITMYVWLISYVNEINK